jgi:hypothetical protein
MNMLRPWVGVSPSEELSRGHRPAGRHLQLHAAPKRYESGTAESEKNAAKSQAKEEKIRNSYIAVQYSFGAEI